MKLTKILAIAVTAIGLGFGANTAQAAPQFLTPDVNYVSHGVGITYSAEGNHLNNFVMSIDTTKGDFMSIDNGSGFRSITGTIVATGEAGTGNVTFTSGELTMSASLINAKLGNALVGKDIFALYRVTSSNVTGVRVGALLGLDGLIYNINSANGISQGNIKGDLAPVVPEPASLSLLLLGLGSLTAAARRRIN